MRIFGLTAGHLWASLEIGQHTSRTHQEATHSGTAETQREVSAPETQWEVSAPETQWEVSAPETQQEVSAPETQREVSAPETRWEVSVLLSSWAWLPSTTDKQWRTQ